MGQLVTVGDLDTYTERVITKVIEAVTKDNLKEFYTPREFSQVTGIKYSTVVYYCNMGMLQAVQLVKGGTWIIYRGEIDKRIQQAKDNRIE